MSFSYEQNRTQYDKEEAQYILVPIQGKQEAVKVFLSDLPDDATHILNVLKGEIAPLELWIRFAVEYYKRGMITQFYQIVNEGTKVGAGIEQCYENSKRERVILLHLRAAYHLEKAKKEDDEKQREVYLDECTNCYGRCDKLDVHYSHPMTWAGKGALTICRGDPERADNSHISVALEIDQYFVPALLEKASIVYSKGDAETALHLYKKALKTGSDRCPASIRLGIGLCAVKLGKDGLARRAFEKVLKIDDRSEIAVRALVGLALVEINSQKTLDKPMKGLSSLQHKAHRKEVQRKRQNAIQKSMMFIQKALELQPTNSICLNHTANHMFYTGEYREARRLARDALDYTNSKKVQSESHYIMGKCYHVEKDKNDKKAFENYETACKLDPGNLLARLGKAQLHIARGEKDQAIKLLQSVLKGCGSDFNTLRILGSLYSQTGKTTEARKMLEMAVKTYPSDIETWVDLAQVTESSDPEVAQAAYKSIVQLYKTQRRKTTVQVYNNNAVLFQKVGEVQKARETFSQLQNEIEKQSEKITDAKALSIAKETLTTVKYNRGRACEEFGDHEQAKTLYKEIIEEFPSYIHAILRLGIIASQNNENEEAKKRFKQAIAVDEKNIDAWVLLSELELSQGHATEAKLALSAAQKIDNTDPYILMSFGNLYITTMDKRNKAKRTEALGKAWKYFRKLLTMNPNNMYAVNALGVMYAEYGAIKEAKELFKQVRAASTKIPEVWINLGHVYVVEENYDNAVTMYKKALALGNQAQPQILLYLARAYYLNGKLPDCKEILKKAQKLHPHCDEMSYNLALAQEESAITILQKDKGKRTLHEVQEAVEELHRARDIFKRLESSRKIQRDKCKNHHRFCDSRIPLATQHLQYAQRVDREDEERKRLKQKRLAQEKVAAQLVKEEQQQKRKEEEDRKRKRIELSHQKLRINQEAWKLSDIAANDEEIDDFEVTDSNEPKRRRVTNTAPGYEGPQLTEPIPQTGDLPPPVAAPTTEAPQLPEDPYFAAIARHSDDEDDFVPEPDKEDDHVIYDHEDAESAAYVEPQAVPITEIMQEEEEEEDGEKKKKKKKKDKKKKKKKKRDKKKKGGRLKRKRNSSDEEDDLPYPARTEGEEKDGHEGPGPSEPSTKRKRTSRVIDDGDDDDDEAEMDDGIDATAQAAPEAHADAPAAAPAAVQASPIAADAPAAAPAPAPAPAGAAAGVTRQQLTTYITSTLLPTIDIETFSMKMLKEVVVAQFGKRAWKHHKEFTKQFVQGEAQRIYNDSNR